MLINNFFLKNDAEIIDHDRMKSICIKSSHSYHIKSYVNKILLLIPIYTSVHRINQVDKFVILVRIQLK